MMFLALKSIPHDIHSPSNMALAKLPFPMIFPFNMEISNPYVWIFAVRIVFISIFGYSDTHTTDSKLLRKHWNQWQAISSQLIFHGNHHEIPLNHHFNSMKHGNFFSSPGHRLFRNQGDPGVHSAALRRGRRQRSLSGGGGRLLQTGDGVGFPSQNWDMFRMGNAQWFVMFQHLFLVTNGNFRRIGGQKQMPILAKNHQQ